MMEITEVAAMLSETGFPVAYDDFEPRQSMPCICFYESGNEYHYSDNSNGPRTVTYTAELYTRAKQPAAERALETALRSHGITWFKGGDMRNREAQWFRIDYEFNVIDE